METSTEHRVVSIIDRALSELSRRPQTTALDALLDLRQRVQELAAFEWIVELATNHDDAPVHGPRRKRTVRGTKARRQL